MTDYFAGPIQPDAADRLITDIQKAAEDVFEKRLLKIKAEKDLDKAEQHLMGLREKVRKELHRMKHWCGYCGIKCNSDHQ